MLYKESIKIGEIRNVAGERNSLKVYSHILGFESGTIDINDAKKALNLFSEYLEESRKKTGKHPNIDHLIELTKTKIPIQAVIEYDVPQDLKTRLLQFYEMKIQGCLLEKSEEATSDLQKIVSHDFEIVDRSPGCYINNPCISLNQKIEKEIFQGWSDIAQLNMAGIQSINYGPGKLKLAHSPREKISITELEKFYREIKFLLEPV